MKSINRVIATLLVLIWIAALSTSAMADTPKYISLDDAVRLMEADNIQIKLLDKKIQISERLYRDALDKANWATGKVSPLQGQSIQYRKDELLNWQRRLWELDNLKNEKARLIKTIKNNIEKQYIDAQMLQEDQNTIRVEIQNLQKNIEQLKLREKAGQIKTSDIKSMENQKIQLQAQINTLQRQMEVLLLGLKKDMGMDTKTDILPVSMKKVFKKFDDMDLDTKIQGAVERSFELQKQKKDIELTKLEHRIIVDCAVYNYPPEVTDLEYSIKDKEAAAEEAKLSLEASLWNSYYNLKNLEDDVEIEKLNLQMAELELQAVNAKVKAGKAGTLDTLKSRLEVSKQKNKLQKAINTYMFAAEDLSAALLP